MRLSSVNGNNCWSITSQASANKALRPTKKHDAVFVV